MKKVCFLLVALCLVFAALSVTVQATPEIADNNDKPCGFCHSGGRHHGR